MVFTGFKFRQYGKENEVSLNFWFDVFEEINAPAIALLCYAIPQYLFKFVWRLYSLSETAVSFPA